MCIRDRVSPEEVILKENLKRLGITQEQLIMIAMLIGTDYNSGVKGYGPKKSYKLVKEEKVLEKVLKTAGWDSDVSAEELMDLFINPKVKDLEMFWAEPDPEKIIKVMVDDFEFGLERTESRLKGLEDLKEKRKQKGLGDFF